MKKHLITLGITLGIIMLFLGIIFYPIEIGIPLIISLGFIAIYITVWALVDDYNTKTETPNLSKPIDKKFLDSKKED